MVRDQLTLTDWRMNWSLDQSLKVSLSIISVVYLVALTQLTWSLCL